MIKIHLLWRKPSGAIGAWHVAKAPQDHERRVLASSNTGDLLLPIPRVVRDICSTLIPTIAHAHTIERTFYPGGRNWILYEAPGVACARMAAG